MNIKSVSLFFNLIVSAWAWSGYPKGTDLGKQGQILPRPILKNRITPLTPSPPTRPSFKRHLLQIPPNFNFKATLLKAQHKIPSSLYPLVRPHLKQASAAELATLWNNSMLPFQILVIVAPFLFQSLQDLYLVDRLAFYSTYQLEVALRNGITARTVAHLNGILAKRNPLAAVLRTWPRRRSLANIIVRWLGMGGHFNSLEGMLSFYDVLYKNLKTRERKAALVALLIVFLNDPFHLPIHMVRIFYHKAKKYRFKRFAISQIFTEIWTRLYL